MTDRELLELAALASGISASWDCDPEIVVRSEGMFLNGERSPDNSKYWNPLTDDGDALRLAVKLHIDFKCYSETVRTWVGDPVAQKVIASIEELTKTDPYAATRRAIVRAAAEIGKSMAGQSNHPAKVA